MLKEQLIKENKRLTDRIKDQENDVKALLDQIKDHVEEKNQLPLKLEASEKSDPQYDVQIYDLKQENAKLKYKIELLKELIVDMV